MSTAPFYIRENVTAYVLAIISGSDREENGEGLRQSNVNRCLICRDDRTAHRSWYFTIAPSNNSRRVGPIMKTWKARLSRRYGAYIADALTVICTLHADVIIIRNAVHEKRTLMILFFFFFFFFFFFLLAATLERSPSIFISACNDVLFTATINYYLSSCIYHH